MTSNLSTNELDPVIERGYAYPLDTIQHFAELAIPSASISEGDLTEDEERKHKETKRKRQILAFVIICILVVGGIVVDCL
jgi:hypothetical protein